MEKLFDLYVQPELLWGLIIDESHENKIKEMAQLANIPLTKAIQTEYGLKTE